MMMMNPAAFPATERTPLRSGTTATTTATTREDSAPATEVGTSTAASVRHRSAMLLLAASVVVVVFFLAVATGDVGSVVSSVRGVGTIVADSSSDDDHPTFEEFAARYGKTYGSDEERIRRRSIYDRNLATIRAHNDRNRNNAASGGGWTMGVNRFADLEPEELPTGLRKDLLASSSSLLRGPFSSSSSSYHDPRDGSRRRRVLVPDDVIIGIDDLPDEVDWRKRDDDDPRSPTTTTTTPVKDQGGCGSCWAVATATALETHAALSSGEPAEELSTQELVSCSGNPDNCGGTGGCGGSTPGIALDFAIDHGMVSERDYAYSSYRGSTGTCRYDEHENDEDENEKPQPQSFYPGATVTVDGYESIPSNSYGSLLEAVATIGPVVVSVAASRSWQHYRGGVLDDFDLVDHYDVNHAVVVEGYGTDPDTGEKYWLVRNSWGPWWGELGYIRLKRSDPGEVYPLDLLDDDDDDDSSSGEDDDDYDRRKRLREDGAWREHCKLDVYPADGSACTGPDGTDVPPIPLVCGTSAILYDAVVPLGVRKLSSSRQSSSSSSAS